MPPILAAPLMGATKPVWRWVSFVFWMEGPLLGIAWIAEPPWDSVGHR
jgi:hypothetical protein